MGRVPRAAADPAQPRATEPRRCGVPHAAQSHRLLRRLVRVALVLAAVPAAATFTRVTTGDLVTVPAWYWNGAWGDYDDDG